MQSEAKLILPYPPSANLYWRNVRGVMKVSAAGRAYKEAVRLICYGRFPRLYMGPVRIHADIFRPRRIGDLDNTPKVLFDALKGIIMQDDSQVYRLTFERWDHLPKLARVQLTITEDPGDRELPDFWVSTPGDLGVFEHASGLIEAVQERGRQKARAKREAKKQAMTEQDYAAYPRPSNDHGGHLLPGERIDFGEARREIHAALGHRRSK